MKPLSNLLVAIIVGSIMIASCSFDSSNATSLVATGLEYSIFDSTSSQWSGLKRENGVCIPISVKENVITICVDPISKLRITEKISDERTEDCREIMYDCANTQGTQFNISFKLFSDEVEMHVDNSNIKMTYLCHIADSQPYYEMVDLGLSCKWGMSNYYNYDVDIVSAIYGGGKRLQYDDAIKLFGSEKRHIPSSEQINELLTKCSWEYIDNPDDSFHKCFLVTGPNGNSIFLPCSDGGDGNFSSAWYLGADVVDAYFADALQLNVNNKIIYPYERHYYGCVRLVEEK